MASRDWKRVSDIEIALDEGDKGDFSKKVGTRKENRLKDAIKEDAFGGGSEVKRILDSGIEVLDDGGGKKILLNFDKVLPAQKRRLSRRITDVGEKQSIRQNNYIPIFRCMLCMLNMSAYFQECTYI